MNELCEEVEKQNLLIEDKEEPKEQKEEKPIEKKKEPKPSKISSVLDGMRKLRKSMADMQAQLEEMSDEIPILNPDYSVLTGRIEKDKKEVEK